MGLRQLIRNTVFGLGLALTSACGSSQSWGEGEAEAEGESISLVSHYSQRTDQNGQTTFQEEGRNVPVRVKDIEGNLLAEIDVHYLFGENSNTILAVDNRGNYLPGKLSFTGAKIPPTSTRRHGFGGEGSDLESMIELTIEAITTTRDFLVEECVELAEYQEGDVLERGEDVNRYCLTREQILNNTINVPAGLVFLAVPADPLTSCLLRIGTTTTLREIAEYFIISRHGKQEGYEVWVPRTAVSLCGENYGNDICSVSDKESQNILPALWNPNPNSQAPYWRINGACTPRHIGEGEAEAEAEGEGRCGGSPLVGLYAWEVYGCHAGTTELADGNCRVTLGSDVLHIDGNEFWVNSDAVGRFTRDVSADDISRCYSIRELDLCAVNTDPEIYMAPINGDFCMGAGLYRLTNTPWPSPDGCRSHERSQSWYSKCGHDIY